MARLRFLSLVTACAVAGASLAAEGPRSQKIDTSPKALTKLATAYVAELATKLKRVIAKETYVQEAYVGSRRINSRLMRGDFFLEFLPADHEWMSVHDFVEVDGEPVPDRGELPVLLRKGLTQSIVRDVALRNARYNIGTVARSFNEPTLALLVFDERRVGNFKFSRESVETVGEDTLVTLSFKEGDRGTIVASETFRPVPSQGEVVLEARTGQVRRTLMTFKYGKTTAELTTVYTLQPKLELWVPATFTERYDEDISDPPQRILCTARYTDYQRFETSGRIVR